jgi:hypothetical protein
VWGVDGSDLSKSVEKVAVVTWGWLGMLEEWLIQETGLVGAAGTWG